MMTVSEPFYLALKARSASIDRLNKLADFAYNLFMSQSLNEMSWKDKTKINKEIMTEQNWIKTYDEFMIMYLN